MFPAQSHAATVKGAALAFDGRAFERASCIRPQKKRLACVLIAAAESVRCGGVEGRALRIPRRGSRWYVLVLASVLLELHLHYEARGEAHGD